MERDYYTSGELCNRRLLWSRTEHLEAFGQHWA